MNGGTSRRDVGSPAVAGAAGSPSSLSARTSESGPGTRTSPDPSEVAELSAEPSVASTDPVEGTDELDTLVGRVEDAGLDAYAAALTPPDVGAIGFEVVRVLAPAAQPLFTGDRYFGERARRVPRDLGFRPRLDRAPHPYP